MKGCCSNVKETTMTNEDLTQKITTILAKCWSDKAFKQELLTNTAATLQAEGVQVPAGYTVKVMENTNDTLNFVLPPNPNGELSDLELESVAGGKPGPTTIATSFLDIGFGALNRDTSRVMGGFTNLIR